MKVLASLLLFFITSFAVAQEKPAPAAPPFWTDITNFKKQDAAKAPQQQAILFVGSSSFTRWRDVQSYFPNHTIINRGFGGSTLVDVIRYVYDVVLPYKPKQVVIYCGENDVASGGPDANEVVHRFKTLYGMIRENLPDATIDFVSLKPSPSRTKHMAAMIEVNKQIKAFLEKQKNAHFINIFDAMLDANGQPRPELFVEDMLHMKPEGYAIWQKIMEPYLVK
ncbi:GDSL-type esterase/lipase family protein [Chitinophaga horti]|uniref:GDSL-type esterase/lipase family protein n=1 Tax=Chitinophaga horti TaxID=2920382 RepID=A0ABY6IVK0_9BACT|nr:GDSL-type esterase/lipase family protein [Chitinophaga horti]UYQ91398.1 GDSL-type esterase/lipase family protein [Chitinophaga horti]